MLVYQRVHHWILAGCFIFMENHQKKEWYLDLASIHVYQWMITRGAQPILFEETSRDGMGKLKRMMSGIPYGTSESYGKHVKIKKKPAVQENYNVYVPKTGSYLDHD